MLSVMPGQTFVLNSPTLAITTIDGARAPITIPQNATVRAGQPLEGRATLIEVHWEGRSLLMFIVDLQQRGTPVQSAGH